MQSESVNPIYTNKRGITGLIFESIQMWSDRCSDIAKYAIDMIDCECCLL